MTEREKNKGRKLAPRDARRMQQCGKKVFESIREEEKDLQVSVQFPLHGMRPEQVSVLSGPK